jgi:hypothetical protein
MRLLLHPHRAEILAACALVMRQAAPLPEGLARLAVDDLLLQPWVERLAPQLRSGRPLPEVLRGAGLLSRRECAVLSAEPDLAQALDRFSSSVLVMPRWTWLIRHFPLVLTTELAGLALLLSIVFHDAFANIDGMYDALGMIPTLNTMLSGHPGQMALIAGLAIGAMALCDWSIRSLRGLRHISHLWCPEVARQHALLHLIQAARRDERQPLPLQGVQRVLARLRIGALRSGKPAWDIHWRTWMFLTRFRLDRMQRREALQQADLTQRLMTLGVVAMDRGKPDWASAESDCQGRLATAEAELLLLLRPALLWVGLVSVMLFNLSPLMKILLELARQT